MAKTSLEKGSAGNKGERVDERVEVMRGRGLLHVTLGEKVVNPRMDRAWGFAL